MKKRILSLVCLCSILLSGCGSEQTSNSTTGSVADSVKPSTGIVQPAKFNVDPFVPTGITTDKWDLSGNTDVETLSDADVKILLHDIVYSVNHNLAEACMDRFEKLCSDHDADVMYNSVLGCSFVADVVDIGSAPYGSTYMDYFTTPSKCIDLTNVSPENYRSAVVDYFCSVNSTSFIGSYLRLYQSMGSDVAADAILCDWLSAKLNPLGEDVTLYKLEVGADASRQFGGRLGDEAYDRYSSSSHAPDADDLAVWSEFFDGFSKIEGTIYSHIKDSCSANGITLSDFDSKISLDVFINGLASALFVDKNTVPNDDPCAVLFASESFDLYSYVNDAVVKVMDGSYWPVYELNMADVSYKSIGYICNANDMYIRDTFFADESFSYLVDGIKTMEKAFESRGLQLVGAYDFGTDNITDDLYIGLAAEEESSVSFYTGVSKVDDDVVPVKPAIVGSTISVTEKCTVDEWLDYNYTRCFMDFENEYKRKNQESFSWSERYIERSLDFSWFYLQYGDVSRALKSSIICYEAITGEKAPVDLSAIVNEDKRMCYKDLLFDKAYFDISGYGSFNDKLKDGTFESAGACAFYLIVEDY